jgi:proteasome lid subunit RPN8/RPN11
MHDYEDRGWELYGIFHSHTHTRPYPSSTDVTLAANWPEVYYLIVGVDRPGGNLGIDSPILRAYSIRNGEPKPVEISTI